MDLINRAARRHAPNHLNLGIRFGGDAHDALVKASRETHGRLLEVHGGKTPPYGQLPRAAARH